MSLSKKQIAEMILSRYPIPRDSITYGLIKHIQDENLICIGISMGLILKIGSVHLVAYNKIKETLLLPVEVV